MVGFSALTCGKAPAEVEATVKPFISSVIEACTRHHFFVEKTIGDEVMVVAPLFPEVSDPLRHSDFVILARQMTTLDTASRSS